MAIPDEVRKRILDDFPHLAHLMDTPELADLFNTAYEKSSTTGLSDGEFLQMLWSTPWFRERAESARKWDVMVSQDPGEATRRRESKRFAISNTANLWGVRLTSDQLTSMVEQSLRWDLTDAEIKSSLAAIAGADRNRVGSGTLVSTRQQLRGLAGRYFQVVSDTELNQWAADIMAGRSDMAKYESMFKTQAKSEFNHLADKLDDFDMETLTSGMRNRLAALLDREVTDIDLADDRYSHLLTVDDGKGGTRMATMSEVSKWGRRQSEYRGSEAGRRQGNRSVAALAGALGVYRR